MANIRDLASRLQLQAPDAPEPVLTRCYVDSAREFFSDTLAWQTDDPMLFASDFDAPAATAAFTVLVGDGQEVVDARSVRYGNEELRKATLAQMRRQSTETARPQFFRLVPGSQLLVLSPPNAEADQITGMFAIQPSRDAQDIDNEAANRFGDAIEYGALARLLMMPHSEWREPETAAYYRGLFQEAKDKARATAADEGMVGVPRRVRYGGY